MLRYISCVLFLILIVNRSLSTKKVKMLLVLAEQGPYYHEKINKERKGTLTNNGMRMSYLLGKYYRKRYKDFFTDQFNFNTCQVIASDQLSAQQSANAFMLGLFDLGTYTSSLDIEKKYYTPEWYDFNIESEFETVLPEAFLPIPVRSSIIKREFFKAWDSTVCPNMKYFRSFKQKHNQEIEAYASIVLEEMIKEGFDWNVLYSKRYITNPEEFISLYEYVKSQKYLGNELVSEDCQNRLQIVATMYMLNHYFFDKEITRYSLKQILDYIYNRVKEVKTIKEDKYLKKSPFYLITGQDLNLLNLFSILHLTNFYCLTELFDKKEGVKCMLVPEYASSVAFEYSEDNNEQNIDLFINGERIEFCGKFGREKCSFEDFQAIMSELIIHEEKNKDGFFFCKDKNKIDDISLLFTICGCWLIIFIFMCCVVKYNKQVKD